MDPVAVIVVAYRLLQGRAHRAMSSAVSGATWRRPLPSISRSTTPSCPAEPRTNLSTIAGGCSRSAIRTSTAPTSLRSSTSGPTTGLPPRDDARAKGARLANLAEGQTPDKSKRRLPPHIVLNVTPEMELMRREIFGPILPILTYDEPQEVVDAINARDRPRPSRAIPGICPRSLCAARLCFGTLQADVVAAMAKAGQRGSRGMRQPPSGGDQLFQPGALLALEQFDHPRDLRAFAGGVAVGAAVALRAAAIFAAVFAFDKSSFVFGETAVLVMDCEPPAVRGLTQGPRLAPLRSWIEETRRRLRGEFSD